MRLSYDVQNGRAAGIRIEHGPGTPDPAQLALHQRTAVQLAEAGGLRQKLNGLLTGRPTPPVGSAAHEATLELDKIQREAQAIGDALGRAHSPAERNALAIRQRELDQALTREAERLNAPEAAANGFVAAPRSLSQLLDYYSGRGDIAVGVPADMAPLTAPPERALPNVQ